jgi:hypothetical protein
MLCSRNENGKLLTVRMAAITKKPKAPADQLVGVWALQSETKTETQPYVFFRWDRIYRAGDAEGKRSTGYWHINGHRPEITLLSHTEGQVPESWRISFETNTLIMTGISDSNKDKIVRYQRLDYLP